MPADERTAAFALADARAAAVNMEKPSAEAWLIQRMAWGMHASQRLPSPRAAWLEMDDGQRATLYLRAAGALAAYRRYAEFAPEPGA